MSPIDCHWRALLVQHSADRQRHNIITSIGSGQYLLLADTTYMNK